MVAAGSVKNPQNSRGLVWFNASAGLQRHRRFSPEVPPPKAKRCLTRSYELASSSPRPQNKTPRWRPCCKQKPLSIDPTSAGLPKQFRSVDQETGCAEDGDGNAAMGCARVCFIPPAGSLHFTKTTFLNAVRFGITDFASRIFSDFSVQHYAGSLLCTYVSCCRHGWFRTAERAVAFDWCQQLGCHRDDSNRIHGTRSLRLAATVISACKARPVSLAGNARECVRLVPGCEGALPDGLRCVRSAAEGPVCIVTTGIAFGRSMAS